LTLLHSVNSARQLNQSGLIDDADDAAVETLDQTVSLRMTWRNKAVLNIALLAQPVEQVPIRWIPRFCPWR
jgi:hypothetical protein